MVLATDGFACLHQVTDVIAVHVRGRAMTSLAIQTPRPALPAYTHFTLWKSNKDTMGCIAMLAGCVKLPNRAFAWVQWPVWEFSGCFARLCHAVPASPDCVFLQFCRHQRQARCHLSARFSGQDLPQPDSWRCQASERYALIPACHGLSRLVNPCRGCLRNIYSARLIRMSFGAGVEVGSFLGKSEGLQLGQLWGNRFRVRLRTLGSGCIHADY